jgi:hypothetical protein
MYQGTPFQNLGRDDNVDTTVQNLDNQRYANYILSNFSLGVPQSQHVDFATSQPSIMYTGLAQGEGLNGDVVDFDSTLNIQKQQERPLEKIQLFQRPFVTVPFMGRGFCPPVLESQLIQGETTNQQKSVGTIMESSFLPLSVYPVDTTMQQHVDDTSFTVEEAALKGWVRGGSMTRD